MADQTIKSFLVRLGYNVDESGHAKFEQSLASAGMQATKLGAAVVAAGAAVTAFATKVASGMDQLYFASQRTGATVQGIQSIGYAASQTGSSAQAAQGALEGLARFVRNNPGGEAWINRLGIQTRNARGEMRDTADVFMDIGQRLQRMPFFQRNQFAQQLGIDEKTLIAMSNGMRRARDEYNGFAHDIGYNGQRAARESHGFMTALRRLYSVSGLLSDKIGSDTAGSLTNSVNYFTQLLVQNAPSIEHWAQVGINAAKQVGQALYDNRDSFKTIAVSAEGIAGNLGDVLRAAGRLSGLDMGNGTFASSLGVLSDRISNIARFMSHLSSLTDNLMHRRWSAAAQDAKGLLSETFNGPAVRGVQAGWHGLVNAANRSAANQDSANYRGPRGEALIRSQSGLFGRLEQMYRLPAGLLGAVAHQESRGNPFAVSPTGARGEFQFMPGTAAQYGLHGDDVNDPNKSAQAAARYYGDLMRRYHGNLNKALSAYNWGSGNLDRLGYDNRPRETRNYVDGVTGRMQHYAANTTVNVTVHGNGDARQIGREVSTAVNNANSRNSQVTGARSR